MNTPLKDLTIKNNFMFTPLKDLTIKNNFMFAAVMSDEENCKGFLERALPIKIEHVEIHH